MSTCKRSRRRRERLGRRRRRHGDLGFEPLAGAFAEACLAAFVAEHLTIGESIRRAHLHVLAQRNPLGLVYVPFVLSTLRLVDRA